MSKKFVKIFAVPAILLLSVFNSPAQTRITGMQAKLFYQNTGKFSEDIFTTQSDLWNVSFDSVYSVLVIVEAEGKMDGKQFIKPQMIELIARYKPFFGAAKEITVRRNAPIWSDENGRANVGFWIANVGCEPVKITAKIAGQKTNLRKTINFGCGE